MVEFIGMPDADRRDALLVAANATGRPPYLLEKDVWVVWALNALFQSDFGEHLVFKGGTSLSKGYGGLIRRFSEDIDLTYDIHQLIPDLTGEGEGDPLPDSRSQSDRWSKQVNKRLPSWLSDVVVPALQAAIASAGVGLSVAFDGVCKVTLTYTPLFTGTGYVKPEVVLEFGARSSGQPAEFRDVTCDAASAIPEISFPAARPRVMAAERTFWEKATAAHVYCLKGKMSPRYARHWYDIFMLDEAGHANKAIDDRDMATQVAEHKGWFFREKDAENQPIDYQSAINGSLRLAPEGEPLEALKSDYQSMIEEGMFEGDPPSFDDLMARCREIESNANGAEDAN